ncbi:MAG: SoxR reducing system RseC family protein [Desulfobacterales bacterium]|nr:SoxR reducing system RseC family protein [Desulfobacterales bacterium]
MSYRIGIVKETEPGGYAQVETERKTVCGECEHKKIVCYGCLLNPKIVGRVANPIGASKGDVVKVYMSSKKLFLAAGLFYLVPIFALVFGAFAGLQFSSAFNVSENALTLGFGIAGFLVSVFFVTIFGRTKILTRLFQPAIIEITLSKESSG